MRYTLFVLIIAAQAGLIHSLGRDIDRFIEVADIAQEFMWLEGYETGISEECDLLIPDVEATEHEA